VAGSTEHGAVGMTPAGPPLWLLAELTYRCPLHCVFCYNPTQHAQIKDELSTAQWVDVMRQARALGAAQLGFSGGEPLVRDDLEELVQEAHALGYYTNLITSGVGLTEARAQRLKDAGLDHVQLSFQDSTRELNDFLSHTRTFELKQKVARLIKAHDWPMVMNCVLHRHNLPHVGQIIEMALELGAEYLELANTQYYGWALHNRRGLLPSRAQVESAEAVVRAARDRLSGRMEVVYVLPDYFSRYPKPCMGGWGRRQLTVVPTGDVLPCPTAHDLPLPRASVRDHSLAWIWEESPLFRRFRGTDWMPDPCRSCPRRGVDFGGCRCQAFALTGDAARTDPVCHLAPDHGIVAAAVRAADEEPGPRDTLLSPRRPRLRP
jgi:pyrroloquinoline quinone biosynthesis protein E